jgi:nitrogen fixation protein NifU and related proteins
VSSDLNKLYSKTLKAHNENPFHFEKPGVPSTLLKAYNPICGDRFEIYISPPITDHRSLITMSFTGFGCAISKASTSVLMKSLTGKSREEALEITDVFLRYLNKELRNNDLILPDFAAFAGVHDFPERLECAALAWKEIKKFLESRNELD